MPPTLSGRTFTSMEHASIFAYNDFRLFLRDWWTTRNASDRELTKSEVSKRLGLPNTRSYFTDVLAGKKVTELFVERFTQVLDLTVDEARYFRTLVQFNQSDTPEDREVAFDRLVSLNRTPYRRLDPKEYRYYKSWWNGALRAVLAIEDHGEDWEALAVRLRPAITTKQAKDSVLLMEELGLVRRDERGFWKPTETTLSTGNDIRDEMVLQLQMQQFELARHAIMSPPGPPRDFATSTIHVSQSGLSHIRERLDKFRSEVRSIAHKDPEPADRVYSLCLAFFPLTQER
ncbi:MAG: TIGR02147 family protein [Fibrobacterota bacterium]|nr:MAG: TIGR02147 family protein [Fibrobacterota bacterium]